jgi:hypothetical protein
MTGKDRQAGNLHSESRNPRSPDFSTLAAFIRRVHERCALQAARAVNVNLTLRNRVIGWYIREYESNTRGPRGIVQLCVHPFPPLQTGIPQGRGEIRFGCASAPFPQRFPEFPPGNPSPILIFVIFLFSTPISMPQVPIQIGHPGFDIPLGDENRHRFPRLAPNIPLHRTLPFRDGMVVRIHHHQENDISSLSVPTAKAAHGSLVPLPDPLLGGTPRLRRNIRGNDGSGMPPRRLAVSLDEIQMRLVFAENHHLRSPSVSHRPTIPSPTACRPAVRLPRSARWV